MHIKDQNMKTILISFKTTDIDKGKKIFSRTRKSIFDKKQFIFSFPTIKSYQLLWNLRRIRTHQLFELAVGRLRWPFAFVRLAVKVAFFENARTWAYKKKSEKKASYQAEKSGRLCWPFALAVCVGRLRKYCYLSIKNKKQLPFMGGS